MVNAQVFAQPFPCLSGGGVIFQIDLLICNRAPQAFGKNIVKRSTEAHHANTSIMREQQLGILRAGKRHQKNHSAERSQSAC
jgi:hypothetical protein